MFGRYVFSFLIEIIGVLVLRDFEVYMVYGRLKGTRFVLLFGSVVMFLDIW